MRRLVVTIVLALAGAVALGALLVSTGGSAPPKAAGLLPDIRTVVPAHLQLVNEHQRETLRFANGIANTGAGPWALRPEPPLELAVDSTTAVQELRDSNAAVACSPGLKPGTPCYRVVSERAAGTFVYHPAHNHWHIGDVALFEVRKGSPTGPIVGDNSVKTTFCLIDGYKLDDNAPTSERAFWDCYRAHQGIASGWVDQYHQATSGQQLDLTGVPSADDLYLVSTSNHARTYAEASYDNNTAWVRFHLFADSKGNRKIEVTDRSPCESPGLCGERSTNR